METELTKYESQPLTVAEMTNQVALIQQMMKGVMIKDTHFGVIPGCGKKPTLLKPGAEKLSMTFRLAPSYEIIKTELPGNHREYELVCTLTHINTGQVWGQGVGCCSSLEGKYRYRKVWDNGVQTKVENEDPADQYNTVLKMAKKRAHVDAVLTATAASDIFTQDIEDMKFDSEYGKDNKKKTTATTTKAPPTVITTDEQKAFIKWLDDNHIPQSMAIEAMKKHEIYKSAAIPKSLLEQLKKEIGVIALQGEGHE